MHARSVKYTFVLDMPAIMDNIYICVFLVNSESVLLLAFIKQTLQLLYSFIVLYFLYILEAKNPCFVTKNCSKSSYICVFILPKKQHN